MDGTDGYAFFVNENKYNIEIKSLLDILNFLKSKYLTDHDGYISEDQQEWIENPDKCPACGYSGVTNKNICPNCGSSSPPSLSSDGTLTTGHRASLFVQYLAFCKKRNFAQ